MKAEIIEKLRPYQRTLGYDQKYEWNKIALGYLKNCRAILDVGCGVGSFIALDPSRITGLDHNEDSVQACEEAGYTVKCGEATALPFDNESFDGIYCCHLIEHLQPEDAHKLLSEMNRVLRPGGRLVIQSPLMHRGFFDDFTHIKPYPPQAVMRYLAEQKTPNRTLPPIPAVYKKVKIKYRREELFTSLLDTPFWFLAIAGNFLARFGITNFNKTGYMLVLEKIA